jgi:hypothetical protein
VGGCSEHGNDRPGSIESGEFIEKLSDYYLLKKNSSPMVSSLEAALWD